MGKRKCGHKSILDSSKLLNNYFPNKNQRLHISQFLQKLSGQKPVWDQARLPSLVKKQVAVETAVEAAVEAAGEGVIEAAVDEGGLEEVAVDEAKGFIFGKNPKGGVGGKVIVK